MFYFSVYKIGYSWLEGQTNTDAMAMMRRIWKDAIISAYVEFQKLLLQDIMVLVKAYSVHEWLVSFSGVALGDAKYVSVELGEGMRDKCSVKQHKTSNKKKKRQR